MDLVVEAGCGYQTIEEVKRKRLHSDMIAIDAMYSPVLRVRYKVDSTRVGQETNLDKLAITVETNGTITPREASKKQQQFLSINTQLGWQHDGNWRASTWRS